MCRLTLVYPKQEMDPKFSALITSILVANNSNETGQGDGTGIGIVNPRSCRYIKHTMPGYKFVCDDDWIDLVNDGWDGDLTPDAKFIGHVRQATTGIAVSVKNSHPFIINGILGVHNGTIRNKEDFAKDVESDSEAFFKYLANEAKDDAITYKMLKEALEKIVGAFCMLINDQNNDDPDSIWVVVGKNRELHILENDYFILINTSKPVLNTLFNLYNSLKILGDERYKYLEFPNEPTKLKEESIFFINNGVMRRVGDVKENDFVITTPTANARSFYNQVPLAYRNGTMNSAVARRMAILWAEILDTTNLSPLEALLLCSTFHGRKLDRWQNLTVSELSDVRDFVLYLKANGYLDDLEEKNKIWNDITYILYKYHKTTEECHKVIAEKQFPEFKFPYWLNDIQVLSEISKGLSI